MRTFSIATENVEETVHPTKTYAICGNRIQGYVDGIDAVKQTVLKTLNTEMYEYPIYSFDYGQELQKLIGKEQMYVQSELKRIITDALLVDDRITAVTDFSFEFSGDTCNCKFLVQSTQGKIPGNLEVSI